MKTLYSMVRRCSRTRGQSLVEFTLILPILLLFVLGLFDLGYAVFINNTLASAAREGARAAVIQSNSVQVIQTRVNAAAPGLNLQPTIIPSGTRTFKSPVTVTVDYVYNPLTPLIGNIVGQQHLSATSVMIVEGVIEY